MSVAGRSSVNTASSRPSPMPSSSSHNSDLKRKRQDAGSKEVYSQPQDTGTGRHLMTQVSYAVDYLRDRNQPLPFTAIYRHLNIDNEDGYSKSVIRKILQTHSKVEYDPAGNDGKGSYRYRPPHGVRSAEDLLAQLQKQSTAQGIPVKELKDGWATAIEEIEKLVTESKVLVTRNKKDGSPKMVWPNDPTLSNHIDDDFKALWHDIKVPHATNELRDKLLEWNLTPTSQVKVTAITGKKAEKKTRKPRASGKTTNAHMLKGTLKDYSHMRPTK